MFKTTPSHVAAFFLFSFILLLMPLNAQDKTMLLIKGSDYPAAIEKQITVVEKLQKERSNKLKAFDLMSQRYEKKKEDKTCKAGLRAEYRLQRLYQEQRRTQGWMLSYTPKQFEELRLLVDKQADKCYKGSAGSAKWQKQVRERKVCEAMRQNEQKLNLMRAEVSIPMPLLLPVLNP